MRILMTFGLAFLLYSCSLNDSHQKGFLTVGNIPVQSFSIDPSVDTTLHGRDGSSFAIKKGTFPARDAVTIQIREVITPAAILLSGIPTLSGNRQLKSAGMVSFEAYDNGKSIEPAKAVKVTVPTANVDAAMQIFKGKIGEDSLIDWIDPMPLDTLPLGNLIKQGESLYSSKCQSCHSVFKDGTGPALYNFQQRGPWKNPKALLAFVQNPALFMSTNEYAKYQKSQFGSVMQPFPDLEMPNMQALVAYISSLKSEPPSYFRNALTDSSTMVSSYPAFDSAICGLDTVYVPSDDSIMYGLDTSIDLSTSTETAGSSSFEPYEAGKYEFEISANGWYNIDAYVPDLNSIPGSDLFVSVNNSKQMYVQVILYIPGTHTQQSLTPNAEGLYIIPYQETMLPKDERAIVFAVGSSNEQTYYAVKEFQIRSLMKINLELHETTPEKITNVLATYRIDNIDVRAIENKQIVSGRACSTINTVDSSN